MQDRYTGDIGDYVKYGLLRALSENRKLGVAWYLYPDEDHNSDGRHIDYLDKPKQWRSHDPQLFDTLKTIVNDGRRKVSDIEECGILGSATFSGEVLDAGGISPVKRGAWRSNWFENVQEELRGCDLVFADPDNGLCENDKFRPGRVKDWKRMPLSEAQALANGRTAVIYHHNTRRKGGHGEEVSYWIEMLGAGTLALRWRGYSARTFFVVNPTPDMPEILDQFAREWGPKAEFHHR